jgi:hypothetical protein
MFSAVTPLEIITAPLPKKPVTVSGSIIVDDAKTCTPEIN